MTATEGSPLRAPDILKALAQSVREGRPAALVTVLAVEGESAGDIPGGGKLLVGEREVFLGTTGDAGLDQTLTREARRLLDLGETGKIQRAGVTALIQTFAPPPRLFIIGAVHPAQALAEAGKFVGFRVEVCDPRSPFATPERLPSADAIHRIWPDEFLGRAEPGPRDAVCILTHDLKFDVPSLKVALASRAGYIGAMGSRRTHDRRLAELREQGVDQASLERISSPIGIEIGARTPEEIAISIIAEIIARLRAGS